MIAGIVIGGAINMALIDLGPSLVPAPAGVDVASSESLSEAMHLFEPRHSIMPFLAHAVGAFAGALAACLIAGGLSLRGRGRTFHDSRAEPVHRARPAGRLPADGVAGYPDRYSRPVGGRWRPDWAGVTVRLVGAGGCDDLVDTMKLARGRS